MQELSAWLAWLPESMAKGLSTCTPADILVYMESHWLPLHGGTMLPEGTLIASPSGVNACLSNFSTGFTLIGRVGDWNSLTSQGNPILSTDICQYRKGYKMQAWRLGYLEGLAVPMSSDEVCSLVDHLDSCTSNSATPQQQLLLERDILLVLLMWETPLRGKDIGKVSIEDFFTLEGQPIQAPTGQLHLLSTTLPVGSQLSLRPNGTKTTKCQRYGPFMLTVTSDSQHCFLARLPGYLQQRHPGGPLTSRFLFSPLTPNRRGFADALMGSTSIGHRLGKHLEAAGLYAGESNHGFRRGQIQSI